MIVRDVKHKSRPFGFSAQRGFQQDNDGTASAIHRPGLDKGQDFVLLHQPVTDMMLEYRFTIPGAQSLAMDDANATYAASSAFLEEIHQFMFSFQLGEAMQIQFRLGMPFSATKTTQGLA